MAKTRSHKQAPPAAQGIDRRPPAEEPMRAALSDLALKVGAGASIAGELLELTNDARALTGPDGVRSFLTRALARAAGFAIDHKVYGPLVEKTLEAGLEGSGGGACWSAITSALSEQLAAPGRDTPAERQADRCVVIAAALAAALADPRPELAGDWVREAMHVLWALADDASAPGQVEADLDRLRKALRRDIAELSGPSTLEGGQLGQLWPAGEPGWNRPLPARFGLLTGTEGPRTVGAMAGKQSRAKTKGAEADPLAAAVDAFAEVKAPALPVTSLGKVTPSNAHEVLEGLARYLDEAGEAVVSVLRLLHQGLQGQALADLESTKSFAAKVQELLDRTGFTAVCSTCQQPGRLEGTKHKDVESGVFRIRHGRNGSHGGFKGVKALRFTKKSE